MSRPHIPSELDRQVRAVAGDRCGYCLSPQYLVMARLQIEHIRPRAHGGTDDESNLWLSCPICNGHKSDKVEAVDPDTGTTVTLFNPRAAEVEGSLSLERGRHPHRRAHSDRAGDRRGPA